MRRNHSLTLLRLLCVIGIVFVMFPLPICGSSLIKTMLNFVSGVFFAVYGYLVLRPGRNLLKHIKRVAVAFGIMLGAYLLLSVAYLYFLYVPTYGWEAFTVFINPNYLYRFLVLNVWSYTPFGGTLWYLQAALYALIILYALRKLKKLDWVLCIFSFVVAELIGEGAGLIGMDGYIPGNFFTRAIPYMLLGRIIYKNEERLEDISFIAYIFIFVGGAVLSLGEYLGLKAIDKLVYSNHLIGFPAMAFSIIMLAVLFPEIGRIRFFHHFAGPMYKTIFYAFSPLCYAIEIVALIIADIVGSESIYYGFVYASGVISILLLGGIAVAFTAIKNSIRFEMELARESTSPSRFDEPDTGSLQEHNNQ